jgi:drug/metabolite transporter (DMT)-like permease
MKLAAGLAFLLNTILFATYYSVAKEALTRIDPIVFSFFEMITLVPAALCIIIFSWKDMSGAVIKRGVLLGSWLCVALFTIAIALKYTSATGTAFFPSLNGFLAALIAWLFLRHPVKKLTWFAGAVSAVGTILLIMNSPMGNWRGSLIAFLGGVFFTCYVFLADHEQKDEIAPWPLFGIELLTMALCANLIVLLFGNWQTVHPSLPHDIWVVLYVAGACTFLPTLITVLMQKHISPVTVSFIYILEPILGAFIANIYLREMLPIQGYAGQPSKAPSGEAIQESSWASQMLSGFGDIQSHRQVGTVPYSISRKGEKSLVQRRRRDRLQRLGVIELVELE